MAENNTGNQAPQGPASGAGRKDAAKQNREELAQARENTLSREEVLQQKTPQGQPNRG